MAYLGANDHLKIRSLSIPTKTLSGPLLPDLSIDGLVVSTAGISPNGHLLAYSSANGLHVLDLTDYISTSHIPPISASELLWAPDSTQIAVGDGQGAIGIVNINSGEFNHIPSILHLNLGDIIGWTDANHLAVTITHPANTETNQQSAPLSIGILNISTWNLQTLTTFSPSDSDILHFVLSPNNKQILFFNKRFGNDTFTPKVGIITLNSGQWTLLPHITQAEGSYSGFTSLAWSSDNNTIVATSGFSENNDLKMWSLNLSQDTAIPLQAPHAAYVMGWTPANGPLVLSSGWDSMINQGPYEMYEATLYHGQALNEKPIANDAMTFPFLGFARTS